MHSAYFLPGWNAHANVLHTVMRLPNAQKQKEIDMLWGCSRDRAMMLMVLKLARVVW